MPDAAQSSQKQTRKIRTPEGEQNNDQLIEISIEIFDYIKDIAAQKSKYGLSELSFIAHKRTCHSYIAISNAHQEQVAIKNIPYQLFYNRLKQFKVGQKDQYG
jgi:hypothetical protein